MLPATLRFQPRQVAYLPLVWMGLHFHAGRLGLAAILALAAFALYSWTRSLRKVRALVDTPKARIGSAAQGYVALRGRLKPLAGALLVAPVLGCVCVWYRVRIEERHGDDWRTVSHTQSAESLLLADGTGECLVLCDDADILTPHREVKQDQSQRTTVHWLGNGEQVTVLGEFRTRGAADPSASVAQQIGDLLADWKSDRAGLLARFDSDRDGEISLEEWEAARAAARREVLARLAEPGAALDTHLVTIPTDGRPFIVSAMPPKASAWHFEWISALDLAVFFAGLAWLGLMLRGPWPGR
jgi:hypothetical protein